MGKKLLAAAIAVLVCAAITPVENGDAIPADVMRFDGCIIFDAIGTPWWDADADAQIVSTNNGKGTGSAWCHGSIADIPGAVLPTRAMHFDFASTGFTCAGSMVWRQTVTPSGKGNLSCRLP